MSLFKSTYVYIKFIVSIYSRIGIVKTHYDCYSLLMYFIIIHYSNFDYLLYVNIMLYKGTKQGMLCCYMLFLD